MTIHTYDLFLGFLAGAISVLTIHEILVLFLKKANLLPDATPWSIKPIGPFGVPTIVNSAFWGGLWGIVYVLTMHVLPFTLPWEKGLAFGILIALLSNFTLLPLIKQKPLFMGFNVKLIGCVLFILSGFGIATAILFDIMKK
jgi:hypothetical protein